MKIISDGQEYDVDSECFNSHIDVVVTDSTGVVIGTAMIDHGHECITIESDEHNFGSPDYFGFVNSEIEDAGLELGTWMAGTHWQE